MLVADVWLIVAAFILQQERRPVPRGTALRYSFGLWQAETIAP